MIKYFLSLFLIISPSLSAYQSLRKYNGFDKLNDNICGYYYSSVSYVKMCDEGKYCKGVANRYSTDIFPMYMCVDVEKEIKKKFLDETCTQSDYFDECDSNLFCNSNNKCAYSCTGATTIYKTEDGRYSCKPNDMPSGLYYYREYNDDYTIKKTISSPLYNSGKGHDYGKVGGIISFIHNNYNNYYKTKIENAYIGSVKSGEFVEDNLACESGYALLFYPDGGLKDPSTNSYSNLQVLKCVTVNSIDIYDNGACAINYDDDKIYYLSSNCDEFLMTKLKLFKKYIEKFTPEKQESCLSNKDNYNEPKTCNDDEIRKWYYFYEHPEDYILYYEEKDKPNDVVNFLIQQEYKLYQSSKLIYIRHLLLFLILFLI